MNSGPSRDIQAGSPGILAFIAIIFGIALAILKAWIWSGGIVNAEGFGYALAGIIIPGLIAYAIAGRTKVRNPNRFALVFCGISLFFLLLEASNHHESLR